MKANGSRSYLSFLNARVNTFFFLLTLFLSFFSRKIFIESFGADFVGLNGTLVNLLDFLNLAELGIGAAVSVALYQHIIRKDEEAIKEVIAVFGYFYRIVGYCIVVGGIIVGILLPFIFPDLEFPLLLLYSIYVVYLTNVVIGYFANYKQTLLGADQKNYVVITYFQTTAILKTLLQIAIAYYTQNYYLWIAIELVAGICYSVCLNRKIRQVYPWLQTDIRKGKVLRAKYPLILQQAKRLFVHKIGTLVQIQIKPLLIYGFLSLQMVTIYGNYSIIIDKLSQLLSTVLGSTGAGIGQLVAEGNTKHIIRMFHELNAMRYFLAGTIVFSVAILMNPFVSIWLGASYVLPTSTLIIILMNMLMLQTRGTIDQFLYGYGLFQDIWAPIAESFISLGISLIGGYYWGLNGILLGSTVSLFLIVVLWKPLLLYRNGFKRSVGNYWVTILKYYAVIGLAAIVCYELIHLVDMDLPGTFWQWILFALLTVSLFMTVNFLGYYFLCPGFRAVTLRILNRIQSKK
ncbi:polysaccharide biosynthesis protein [Sphingobacterium corticibacterium]|uniref:Sugar transporter n=1 Tax=Sphingobacterium corticibacterium TaxID=2484746 RepID=A0A4Q6XID7_9SPHI|nr:sugar transporter [Sphingobacterium corticibacterium]RZF59443.1 sugar transporter [Sphingobacterium corticibacterium]